ncbi:hypothetical protein H257_01545 [Aphanomyces astaci]|uniref:Uncharacterized protein n=1 Tax=Aphanomyces astaci TaxID=112090 RepID=W4H883_APHAT|nr:hypothetical protein H257_01545 [Aphanomyces astaci]ETV88240.1 hypothetical protein H257_01545 [Aphanomyces astaci]|eukprot:XP_009823103.1 hypothetical protein H257_01545 [Aphanomyces astaci]
MLVLIVGAFRVYIVRQLGRPRCWRCRRWRRHLFKRRTLGRETGMDQTLSTDALLAVSVGSQRAPGDVRFAQRKAAHAAHVAFAEHGERLLAHPAGVARGRVAIRCRRAVVVVVVTLLDNRRRVVFVGTAGDEGSVVAKGRLEARREEHAVAQTLAHDLGLPIQVAHRGFVRGVVPGIGVVFVPRIGVREPVLLLRFLKHADGIMVKSAHGRHRQRAQAVRHLDPNAVWAHGAQHAQHVRTGIRADSNVQRQELGIVARHATLGKRAKQGPDRVQRDVVFSARPVKWKHAIRVLLLCKGRRLGETLDEFDPLTFFRHADAFLR